MEVNKDFIVINFNKPVRFGCDSRRMGEKNPVLIIIYNITFTPLEI
jgi:hypothetical protein